MKVFIPHRSTITMRFSLAVFALLMLSNAPWAWAVPPPAPANLVALPDYGNNEIIIRWGDVAGETGYRVYRATAMAGPFAQVGGDVAANTVFSTDNTVNDATEYFYKVRAFNVDGESPDSNVMQQNLKIVWPVPTSHEILHGYNDLIGAYASGGFHEGVDMQRIHADDMVVVPRGGRVSRVNSSGVDDNYFFVEVKIGATVEHDSFNHLEGANAAALGISVNDYVYAGKQIANMGKTHFDPWDFIDHTHNFIVASIAANAAIKHPLSIYPNNAEKDPKETKPKLIDHASPADGTVLYHRQGEATAATYLDYNHDTKPLGDDPTTAAPADEGNVDVHVELADEMGTLPDQVPVILSYWIEGPHPPVGGTDFDNVRSAAAPYRLFNWTTAYFGTGGPDWKHVADEAQNLGPSIKDGTETYPYENYKHLIITNTKHGDGTAAHVDASQYWNTNAKNDKTIPPTHNDANFAGKADTTKPNEARFPDGDYTIHVLASDLVHVNEDLQIQNVRLENFPPFVKEITVYHDRDGNAGTQVDGDHPGCEVELYKYKHDNPDPYPGGGYLLSSQSGEFARANEPPGLKRNLCVRILFSEGMDTAWADFKVELDPQGSGGAAPKAFTGAFSETYTANDTWKGQVDIDLDASGNSDSSQGDSTDDAVVAIKARDLRDRNNNHRGMDEDANGTAEADSTDANHKIKLDASAPTTAFNVKKTL